MKSQETMKKQVQNPVPGVIMILMNKTGRLLATCIQPRSIRRGVQILRRRNYAVYKGTQPQMMPADLQMR